MERLPLWVCESLAEEVAAALEAEGIEGAELRRYPVLCGGRGEVFEAFRSALRPFEGDPGDACMIGSHCLARVAQATGSSGQRRVAKLERCFDLLVDRRTTDALLAEGAHLVTAGWLAGWRSHMAQWGFGRELAREFFAEFASKIVLLDVGLSPDSPALLADFAEFVGLPAERVVVGLDLARLHVSRLVEGDRARAALERAERAEAETQRRVAELAAAFDLLGALAGLTKEEDVAEHMLEAVTMLFAPSAGCYVPIRDGQPCQPYVAPEHSPEVAALLQRTQAEQAEHGLSETGDGFFVRLALADEPLGVLAVDGVAFAENVERYLSMAVNIAPAWSLAIANVRAYERLAEANEGLRLSLNAQRLLQAELERSNEEIKQFAYIVSHDLRGPLINIKGFSAELREALEVLRPTVSAGLEQLAGCERRRSAEAIDEDIPEALGFIEASVDRMAHFVTAVLSLSRAGRRELRFEPVESEPIARGILADLSHQLSERRAHVEVGELPLVMADRTSMEQILGNLLGNAVKYLDPNRPGRIELSAEAGDGVTFRVTDNGRGIAERDRDKVFAPFRRAGAQDVAGEGMGLAYVRTLVRRHGGQIGFESEVDVGSVFWFRIPELPAGTGEVHE